MNVEEIRARVQEIKAVAHDYEAAHSLEDALYIDVLKAIRDCPHGDMFDAAGWADEALKASRIDFPRYRA